MARFLMVPFLSLCEAQHNPIAELHCLLPDATTPHQPFGGDLSSVASAFGPCAETTSRKARSWCSHLIARRVSEIAP